jgi:thioredoxin 1
MEKKQMRELVRNCMIIALMVCIAGCGTTSEQQPVVSTPEQQTPVVVENQEQSVVEHNVIEYESGFEELVLANKKLVLVDFYAPWCPPCKMMKPIVGEVSQMPEFKEAVVFVAVNTDTFGDLAQQNDVAAMPTFIFFKDGKKIHTIVGGMSKEKLVEEITALSSTK